MRFFGWDPDRFWRTNYHLTSRLIAAHNWYEGAGQSNGSGDDGKAARARVDAYLAKG